jgi:hypothetical protein
MNRTGERHPEGNMHTLFPVVFTRSTPLMASRVLYSRAEDARAAWPSIFLGPDPLVFHFLSALVQGSAKFQGVVRNLEWVRDPGS